MVCRWPLASWKYPLCFLLFSWLFHYRPLTGAKLSWSQQLCGDLNIPLRQVSEPHNKAAWSAAGGQVPTMILKPAHPPPQLLGHLRRLRSSQPCLARGAALTTWPRSWVAAFWK